MVRLTLIAAAAALCAGSAQAAPAPGRQFVSATVSYRTLDLATPSGQAVLDRRIERTARRLCRGWQHPSAATIAAESRCRREAIASARPQRDLAIANAKQRQRLAGAALALRPNP
jgi:UrcA family protein